MATRPEDGCTARSHAGTSGAARPRELQDALNARLYHPLAGRLARRLSGTPVTPNMVSIAGGLLVVAAALAYAQPGWPWPALAGMALHMTWHVLDGADGDLARMTGRSGAVGELVDGICDYASHIFLYTVLTLVLQAQIGWLAWPLGIAAGLSRVVQANHFEVQRRQYQWWAYGIPWLRTAQSDALAGRRSLGALRAAYLALSRQLAPQASRIDAAVARAGDDAARRDAIRAVIRRGAGRLLAGLSALSANYRTVFLGLSMLAGTPLYYFLYEAVALNAVLAWSVRNSDAAVRRMIAELDQADPSTLR